MSEKSTFMQLRENEREKRKTLIIAAAMNMFKEKSFHDIGMRDIAAGCAWMKKAALIHWPLMWWTT
jgi:hypothetical protein